MNGVMTLPIVESRNRLPNVKKAIIDIIDACPSRCKFCYNALVLDRGRRMGFEKFKSLLEQMPKLERIDIGGGEPFANKDLPAMIGYAAGKGIHVDVSTSALVWSETVIAAGSLAGEKFGLQVNLPAGEGAAFDLITERKGHFALLLSNLPKLVSAVGAGKVRARMTLCGENLQQMGMVADIARSVGIPLYVEPALLVPGNKSTPIEKGKFFGISFFVSALSSAGYEIYYSDPEGKTGCPAFALTYGLKLEQGGCTALVGESVHSGPDGNLRGCEFLN